MLIYCHSSELSALLDLCILHSWHSLFISCLSSYHQRLQHLIHHVVSGISFLFIFISLILITNLIHFILDISHHHILRQQRHHRSRVCLFHSQLKPQLFHKILFSASFFSRLSSWIRTRTTHAAAAKHAGSRQQDRKVSGTWKTHKSSSRFETAGSWSQQATELVQEIERDAPLSSQRTAEKLPSCFRDCPWFCRGEMRSHS